jgi:hypothetical protein
MLNKPDPRPCERFCPTCQQWKHHSRFASRKRVAKPIGLATVHFDPICRDCQQRERNERKNDDRPKAIIENRAAERASKAGVPKAFFMVNMNWNSLIPEFRAMMSGEGRCTSCGHPFLHERDIQLEHREPPRSPTDWARHHARNIGIFCASCNNPKRNKPYAQWLDEQEECRLSNEAAGSLPPGAVSVAPVPGVVQGSLFDEAC